MRLSALSNTIFDIEEEHKRLTKECFNNNTEIEFIEIPFYDSRVKITTFHNGKKFVYIRDIQED